MSITRDQPSGFKKAPSRPTTLLTRSNFLDLFAGTYEKTPAVAHLAWPAEHPRPVWGSVLVSDSEKSKNAVERMQIILRGVVNAVFTDEQRLALLRAHPDLAGKLAVATFAGKGDAAAEATNGNAGEGSTDKLTDHSKQEQRGAGLDQCTPEEFERFQKNNALYKEKFGFPFILAVSGRNRAEILENFEARVGNSVHQELTEAVEQVHRIAAIRIGKIVAELRSKEE